MFRNRMFFDFGPVRQKPKFITREVMTPMYILTVDQMTTVRVKGFQDRFGNPAVVDGAPVWSSSDDTIITLTPSDDGMSVAIDTVGMAGTCQLSCTADSRMGEDVHPIIGILDVQVVAGEAVTITLEADVPTQKP